MVNDETMKTLMIWHIHFQHKHYENCGSIEALNGLVHTECLNLSQ